MNRIWSACNIMIDIINYKKNSTVCKTCYNWNKRKTKYNTLPPIKFNTSHQQPNIENYNNKRKLKINKNKDNNPNVSTYEDHRHVVISSSNVGKTYYMLKILEKIGNKRPIHIINRSPNQYFN